VHIKFLNRGRGDALRAVQYLLRELDHKGEKRTEVRILRGDPTQFAAVANSLNFVHKYSSSVIAWAREDQPTDEQIDIVIEDYMRLCLSGLEPDRHCSTIVLHRDAKGGVHLHCLHARVDLDSGKSHNVAPRGHLTAFYPLRDKYNHTYGWRRPDDPDNARDIQPLNIYTAQQWRDQLAKKGLAGNRDKTKDEIHEYIKGLVWNGAINNREDVIAALSMDGIGIITRQASDEYISVKVEGFKKAFKFSGTLYHGQFSGETYRKNSSSPEGNRSKGGGVSGSSSENLSVHDRKFHSDSRRLSDEAERKLEKSISNRRKYNAERYPKRDRQTTEDHQQVLRTADTVSAGTASPEPAPSKNSEPCRFEPDHLIKRPVLAYSLRSVAGDTQDDDERADGSSRGGVGIDRLSVESVPVPKAMQTDQTIIGIISNEAHRDRDGLQEYLTKINDDHQRAASHALACCQRIRVAKQESDAAGRQRDAEQEQAINAASEARSRIGGVAAAINRLAAAYRAVVHAIDWVREKIANRHVAINDRGTKSKSELAKQQIAMDFGESEQELVIKPEPVVAGDDRMKALSRRTGVLVDERLKNGTKLEPLLDYFINHKKEERINLSAAHNKIEKITPILESVLSRHNSADGLEKTNPIAMMELLDPSILQKMRDVRNLLVDKNPRDDSVIDFIALLSNPAFTPVEQSFNRGVGSQFGNTTALAPGPSPQPRSSGGNDYEYDYPRPK
jgi:hypothetical protein